MNLFEAKKTFKKIYEGKDVKFKFDVYCIRECIFVFDDGKCNEVFHCKYDKTKVFVDGKEQLTIDIVPHRMNFSSEEIPNREEFVRKMISGAECEC